MNYQVGQFTIEPARYRIRADDSTLAVEPKVFDLLVHLIRHRDRVLTREELFQAVWDRREVSDATLSNHVMSARKLLGDSGDLQQSIRRLLDEREQSRLEVDLFKVAHHGSMNNVTSELLDLIDPGVILICTDGTRFGHPDVETIDLLRQHYPSTPIQFTDDTPIVRERAAHAGSVPPSQVPVSFRF